jgi:hypothetical protein
MRQIKCGFFFFLLLFAITHSIDLMGTDVTGQITEQTTEIPIEGALVEFIAGNQDKASATTDVHGLYAIDHVEPGNYTIVISASGYQTKSFGFSLDNNIATIINASLVPNAGIISGTVINENTTNPISGATIKLFQGTTFLTTTSTNTSGGYSFPNLAPGNYIVVAGATGYGTEFQGAVVSIGITTTVNFALRSQQGAIAGTVTDASTTNPISGATVTILNGNTIITSVETDVGGNYSAPNLTPGNYTVIVYAINYQTQSKGATVTAGNTTIVDFALISAPGTIQGIVTRADTNAPISGATVAIFQQVNFIGSVLTSPDGTYLFPGLAPGSYTVIANASNFQIQVVGATVSSSATTTVNFALSGNPGSINGKVIDAVSNNPIAGAAIRVLNGPTLIATAITDSNGNYIIPNIAPDDYFVIAQAPSYQFAVKQTSVTPNNITTVNFALNPFPGTISGTVIDNTTTDPIAGATVVVFQGTTPVAFSLTDANGNYSIPDLASGNYTVVVKAPGYQIAQTAVIVNANATTIVNFALLANPGAVAGTVIDRCAGAGLPGTLVIALDGTSIVSFGLTDSNGQYAIDNLGPNIYTLVATKKNYVISTSSVAVMTGNTSISNFVLTPKALPPTSISGKAFYNKFLNQKEFVHCIDWTASPSGCIKEYQVFRNGKLVKVVPASGQLTFCDHNRNKKKQDTYSVRAVNEFEQMSDFVTITL